MSWALLAVFLLPAILPGQTGLGLSPLRTELDLAGGAVYSGPLRISNESDTLVRVRADLLDFYIDDSGTPQFERSFPAEAENTCRQWLSLNPREIEVDPKSSLTVRYTLRVPPGLSPRSFNCAAGFTTLPSAENAAGMGIRTAVRMIAAFYVVVGNPSIEAEMTGVKVEPVRISGETKWRGVVLLRNWSYRYFRPSGEVALLDEKGAVVETYPFPALPVLPNREQRFIFPLAAAPRSNYSLRARVDMGTHEIQEATFTLTSSEPAQ